jgi:glutathione-regulated potassium-efflux system ancillary protein KefF
MSPVLVLTAHPDLRLSRVNRQLLDAAGELAARSGGALEVRDLYALYPDYLIDVAAEQAACERARLIVWQHPIQWYSMPSLMKLWVDEVLALGWAYGARPDGRPARALAGRDLWLVASTGGPESAYSPSGYNRYFFDAFLPPYEQTAAMCGLRFLPPLLLHGALAAGRDAVEAHAHAYVERLERYPDWPELAELEECPACDMPPGDRPVGAATLREAA